MVKLRAFIYVSGMYLYWDYPQEKNYASANNILKIMNFKKNYILHFLAHIHAVFDLATHPLTMATESSIGRLVFCTYWSDWQVAFFSG